MPTGPEAPPPWVAQYGCVVVDRFPRWVCRSCGREWGGSEVLEPRHGDRVRANLFNFDGRRTDMYPPDVPDPQQTLIGTLVIEDVKSAWGDYVRHAVILDNGAVREVEPDTVRLLGG